MKRIIWLVVVLLVGCGTAVSTPTPTPETIAIAATSTATLAPPTSTPTTAPSVTPTAISTPTATKVSTADIYIVSEPGGALATITDTDLSGQTPLAWTILPGMYTVTLTLDGYEDWITPITVTTSSEITLTVTLRQHYKVFPIEDIGGYLWSLQWSGDGQSLIYSVSDDQWPAHVHLLPVYQNWWRYDVASGTKEALPPLQSRVSNTVREFLGVCPFPLPETPPYFCLTTLQEIPTSNRIAFSSSHARGLENTWLANIDGTDIVYLDSILSDPLQVMWSSDEQWLLIGAYTAIDNTHLYYLVSLDGTFVESLEDITGTSHRLVEAVKPQFSPDGRKVAFVGIEGGRYLSEEQLNQQDAYSLFVLDLHTLEYQLVSTRFGQFQWADDSSGLYILDGSAITAGNRLDFILDYKVQYAELYYIDLTQETYLEQKLADDIPLRLPFFGEWAYSPKAKAMAGTFDLNGPVFAILFLE